MADRTALVVSAHSADFVWRAGGAIALHAEAGVAVTRIGCIGAGQGLRLVDREGRDVPHTFGSFDHFKD